MHRYAPPRQEQSTSMRRFPPARDLSGQGMENQTRKKRTNKKVRSCHPRVIKNFSQTSRLWERKSAQRGRSLWYPRIVLSSKPRRPPARDLRLPFLWLRKLPGRLKDLKPRKFWERDSWPNGPRRNHSWYVFLCSPWVVSLKTNFNMGLKRQNVV